MLTTELIQKRFATAPFDKEAFVPKQEAITVEWLRAFIIDLGLPIVLRPYQERIVVKTVNHFIVDGLKCILIESATGSGKTVMGLTCCLVLQYLTGANTAWTTLRRELLRQAHKTNNQLFKNPEANEEELGLVLLNTISMMSKNPDGNDILVVDEAHKDATASMAHIHECVDARFIILLSATPIRADKATIFYQKIIRDSGIRALIRDGWLSPFRLFSIPAWTPEEVAKCYLADPKRWGKSAVFFHKSEDCQKFKDLLEEAGHHCEMVTGKSDRTDQLDRFERGEYNVLVNMMVLTEGFDCPSLETVFVRDSYKGTTVQMAGRVLRLWDAENQKSPQQFNEGSIVKNVVQSVQTAYPFSKEANPANKYTWDEEANDWKELNTDNKAIKNLRKASMEKKMAHAKKMMKAEENQTTKLDELMKRRSRNRRSGAGSNFSTSNHWSKQGTGLGGVSLSSLATGSGQSGVSDEDVKDSNIA